MGNAKIAAGVALKFLGKLTYPEKVPFAAGYSNKFFIAERYQEFLDVRLKFACARIT
jgi:hypothetical protein